MAQRAKIGRDRIGFFGFSRGGFTGLALIGGEINFRDVLAQCPQGSTQPGCAEARLHGIPTQPLVHGPRIKAAVVVDPLLGRFFTTEGLKRVHLPVQLWASEFGGDGVTHDDAATVDRNLAAKPELHGGECWALRLPALLQLGSGTGPCSDLRRSRRLRPRGLPWRIRPAGDRLLPRAPAFPTMSPGYHPRRRGTVRCLEHF